MNQPDFEDRLLRIIAASGLVKKVYSRLPFADLPRHVQEGTRQMIQNLREELTRT